MALSSASSLATVEAQYDNNASYMTDNSTAQAKLFIEACRILKRRHPSTAQKGGNVVSLRDLQKELDKAEKWLSPAPQTHP